MEQEQNKQLRFYSINKYLSQISIMVHFLSNTQGPDFTVKSIFFFVGCLRTMQTKYTFRDLCHKHFKNNGTFDQKFQCLQGICFYFIIYALCIYLGENWIMQNNFLNINFVFIIFASIGFRYSSFISVVNGSIYDFDQWRNREKIQRGAKYYQNSDLPHI